MSLFSMPFVDTGVDAALHGVALVVLVGVVAAAGIGFWKVHELPIDKAHKENHQQIGLITALTWIGFLWHWVWVLAVMVAFIDSGKALRRIRDIWRENEREVPVTATPEKEETSS
ncbi:MULTISPECIES: MFS transporter [Shewanella]|uniref:MFS transporter n=1 Tax=Shewanella TaxID=22 RepID=UPI001BC00C37|nr:MULTISPECIES: MFS transporter [Shewanella]GIU51029.1 hypothetical protein TUM4249_14110 [Shewanella sp. KT0246]